MKYWVFVALGLLVAPITALPAQAAGTAEQRAACEGDAFKFCGEDIPDAGKIEACLRAKLSQISPACRAQFKDDGKK
ncbi:MAG: hypothetical protein QM651_18800 [Rhodoblastus sp.]